MHMQTTDNNNTRLKMAKNNFVRMAYIIVKDRKILQHLKINLSKSFIAERVTLRPKLNKIATTNSKKQALRQTFFYREQNTKQHQLTSPN